MTTTYEKSIEYDPESKDFRMMLDGELVGFGRTYHEAETTLDRLVFELISGTYFSSPTPKPPSCPSCGDAVREPGTCAACQETDGQITTFTRCLTCQKLTEDVVCPDCQITTHRCEAGHALGDVARNRRPPKTSASVKRPMRSLRQMRAVISWRSGGRLSSRLLPSATAVSFVRGRLDPAPAITVRK